MQPRDQALTDVHEPDQWFKGRMYWSNVGKEDEPNYKKVGLELRHMQKCHEEAVQKVEAAKTEAEGLAKGIPTQRGSITRTIAIGNPPTCSREW